MARTTKEGEKRALLTPGRAHHRDFYYICFLDRYTMLVKRSWTVCLTATFIVGFSYRTGVARRAASNDTRATFPPGERRFFTTSGMKVEDSKVAEESRFTIESN